MSESAELWNALNDMRDRLARQEERAKNDAEKIEKMSAKLDKLVTMAAQAEGAGKTALIFGKWGYGFAGVIGATVIANWQAFKKLF